MSPSYSEPKRVIVTADLSHISSCYMVSLNDFLDAFNSFKTIFRSIDTIDVLNMQGSDSSFDGSGNDTFPGHDLSLRIT